MPDPVNRLAYISKEPLEKQAFESWLRMEDAVAFLKDNASESEFVVYASTGCAFLHCVLVPTASVNPPDIPHHRNDLAILERSAIPGKFLPL